jgi:hypothetical protein
MVENRADIRRLIFKETMIYIQIKIVPDILQLVCRQIFIQVSLCLEKNMVLTDNSICNVKK